MQSPNDTSLPFFAYGLFKPGQLGYHRIAQFANDDETRESTVEGVLYERDGTPLLSEPITEGKEVEGYLIQFNSDKEAEEAYTKISEIESESQYGWDQIESTSDDHEKANVLMGLRSGHGGEYITNKSWDGANDPLFNCALEIVADISNKYEETTLSPSDPALRPFFEMQMAYSLLWSSIERYASLRYGLLGDSEDVETASGRLKQMATNEEEFSKGLAEIDGSGYRRLRRADEPQGSPWEFRQHNPAEAIQYYYRIRSNLFHRGKRASLDFDLLKLCLADLREIFQNYVLPGAFGPEWERGGC